MGVGKMRFIGRVARGLCAVAALVLAPGVASAEEAVPTEDAPADAAPAKLPTSLFAAHSSFRSPLISPDGQKMVMRLTVNGVESITAIEIEGRKPLQRVGITGENEVEWFRWAGNHRILVSTSRTETIFDVDLRVTRLFLLDLDKGSFSYVGPKRIGLEGDDVLYVDPDGAYILLSASRDIFTEPDVWRIPLDGTGEENAEKIEPNRTAVWQWYADNDGTVRIGLGWSGQRLSVWYRKAPDEKLKVIGRIKEDSKEELWDVLRIIGNSDEGLMLEDGENGHVALRKFNYATREVGEVVFENPDWDVTDFDLDDDGNPISVYYTDDRDKVVWLDPELAKLQAQLQKALKSEDVWIGSRARDDSRMIVWSGGATDPGAAYLYTPAKKELTLFAEMRPGLPPSALAAVEPVSYRTRDGKDIHAYLTLPPGRAKTGLPLVIMPHGGPYGIRDKLQYSDEVQLLANRGYAVLQPNYRGSGGYGEAFEKLGDGQIGRMMQDDLDDAMDWAIAQGFADPKRVCVVGESYGGYAALWSVLRNPERYRCAASFAGVTDWDSQLDYDADFFSAKGRKSWRTRIRGEDRKFDLDSVSPARVAAGLTRPVLIAHGKLDGNVPFKQFQKLQDALNKAHSDKAEYLVFDKEGHGFNTAEDEQRWYDALLAFLAKNNPAD